MECGALNGKLELKNIQNYLNLNKLWAMVGDNIIYVGNNTIYIDCDKFVTVM